MTDRLPQVPSDPLAQLSADPFRTPSVRASDADRDVISGILATAYSEGRLDASEHADRLQSAMSAKQMGELAPLVADLVPAASRGRAGRPVARLEAPRIAGAAVRNATIGWVVLAVLFNLIWLGTWMGSQPYYYWPFWPMLGTGIPVVLTWMAALAGRKR